MDTHWQGDKKKMAELQKTIQFKALHFHVKPSGKENFENLTQKIKESSQQLIDSRRNSMRMSSNLDNNKEDEQIEEENCELKKAKLKVLSSMKMGIHSLKCKISKLVLTILLSTISFSMFGIVDGTLVPQKQCEEGVCFADKLTKVSSQ